LDNVVNIKFKGSRRNFYYDSLELPFATGEYALVVVEKDVNMGVMTQMAKGDIFCEFIYIRYPTEEWEAAELDEFSNKFSAVSAN